MYINFRFSFICFLNKNPLILIFLIEAFVEDLKRQKDLIYMYNVHTQYTYFINKSLEFMGPALKNV